MHSAFYPPGVTRETAAMSHQPVTGGTAVGRDVTSDRPTPEELFSVYFNKKLR